MISWPWYSDANVLVQRRVTGKRIFRTFLTTCCWTRSSYSDMDSISAYHPKLWKEQLFAFSFCSCKPGALHLSNHINTNHLCWVLFESFSSGWATTTTRLLGPNVQRAKHHSQGDNDALPVRESNQRSATFRSLPRRSTTELSLQLNCSLNSSRCVRNYNIIKRALLIRETLLMSDSLTSHTATVTFKSKSMISWCRMNATRPSKACVEMKKSWSLGPIKDQV